MNISRIGSVEMRSYYLKNEEHQQGYNLLQAKGGVGLFFLAYTPDIQSFKGRLPPGLTVPLKLQMYQLFLHLLYYSEQQYQQQMAGSPFVLGLKRVNAAVVASSGSVVVSRVGREGIQTLIHCYYQCHNPQPPCLLMVLIKLETYL